MKKLISIIAIVALAFSLSLAVVSCKKDQTTTTTTVEVTNDTTVDTTADAEVK